MHCGESVVPWDTWEVYHISCLWGYCAAIPEVSHPSCRGCIQATTAKTKPWQYPNSPWCMPPLTCHIIIPRKSTASLDWRRLQRQQWRQRPFATQRRNRVSPWWLTRGCEEPQLLLTQHHLELHSHRCSRRRGNTYVTSKITSRASMGFRTKLRANGRAITLQTFLLPLLTLTFLVSRAPSHSNKASPHLKSNPTCCFKEPVLAVYTWKR